MDDEGVAARGDDPLGQAPQCRFGILIVDADAAFDRHRNFDLRLHRGNAFADKVWLTHRAGPNAPACPAFRRAAYFEFDLVIPVTAADLRRCHYWGRVGPAE